VFKSIRAVAERFGFEPGADVVDGERRPAPGTPILYPVGTRVTVVAVDHLLRVSRPKRLIGRSGVVEGHEQVGPGWPLMNLVGGLTDSDELWPMADSNLTPA
jgi:hypothetical protein